MVSFELRNNIKPIILGIVIIILLILNSMSLYTNIELIQDPIEQPQIDAVHTLTPFSEYSSQNFDYFNNSIYFYDFNAENLVKMSFNTNLTNITSIDQTKLIQFPSAGIIYPISKVTTNGNRTFSLNEKSFVPSYFSNYTIFEVTKPFDNNTYVGDTPINVTCQIPDNYIPTSSSSCLFKDIKVIGNNLYILKTLINDQTIQKSELLSYNIVTGKIDKDYILPTNNYLRIEVNQHNVSNELWLIFFSANPNIYSYLRLNLDTGTSWRKIDFSFVPFSINSNIDSIMPLLIENKLYIFHSDERTGNLIDFTTFTLQPQFPIVDLTINIVIFVIVAVGIIFRKKIFQFGKYLFP